MNKVSVRIDIVIDQADTGVTESATYRLREELLGLNVISVQIPRVSQSQTGAKSGAELAIVGSFLLTAPDSALLSAVVEVIKSWIGRSAGRTARLEIDGDVLDVRGLSSSEQRLLIEQWIARHNATGS
jgi:hypothetical protein